MNSYSINTSPEAIAELGAARREIGTKYHAILARWHDASSERVAKKGDVAFLVSVGIIGYATAEVSIYANKVEIVSFGAKQGTAIEAHSDGKFVNRRLYRKYDLVLWTEEAIEAFAAEIGEVYSEEHRIGILYCNLVAFDNLRPEYKAKAAAEIERLSNVKPSYRITYQGAVRSEGDARIEPGARPIDRIPLQPLTIEVATISKLPPWPVTFGARVQWTEADELDKSRARAGFPGEGSR